MTDQHHHSDAIEDLGVIAERYCSLVDSRATVDKTEFLLRIYRILPELIAKAVLLPEVPSEETGDDYDEVSFRQMPANKIKDSRHEEWRQLFNSLREELGDLERYWLVFDPTKDTEAIGGSLADDISSLYMDLKESAVRPEGTGDEPPNDLLFRWRFPFYSHWGWHAMGALRALHFLLQEQLNG